MGLLKDRVAIVTGAANGIGRGTALMCAAEGAIVAAVDVDLIAARATATSIDEEHGRPAVALECDVSVRSQVNETVTAVVDRFGRVDVLINTAIAGAPRVPLLETSEELAEQLFRTGPLATMMFIQACHPHMKDRNASIVNFGSGAAITGEIGYAAYGPAKEGIRCLTKVAARELGPDGIRVNAICPAAKTRLMEAWIEEDPVAAAAVEASIPLRRFGDPDTDIPRAVVFLASEYAGYITGHTLMVDGGSCRF